MSSKTAKELYEDWKASPLTPIGGPEWEDLRPDDPVRLAMEREAADPGGMAKRRKQHEITRKPKRKKAKKK